MYAVVVVTALLAGVGTLALRRRGWRLPDSRMRLLWPRNAEKRFLAAVARDAVIMIDKDDRITSWDDCAERLFGYSRRGALGRELHRLVVPERLRDSYARGVEKLRQTADGKPVHSTFETTARRRDGSELPVEITVSSVLVKGLWLAAGVVRDLSERKQREQELHRAKERAEEIAGELAAVNKMLEETTVWAKEMAAQAAMTNAAKSDFLASMSHEIRTPMNGVLGMLALLEQTPLNPEQLDYVETIRYSGGTLLELINQILDLSRVESGKLDFEEVEFDPRYEVEQVVMLFAECAEKNGIELVTTVSNEVPSRFRGDPGRFRQVLINLVGNAIKFTPQGEVSVDVDTAPGEGGRAELRVEVRDTGIGMAPHVVRNLCQPFYQADASIRRKFGGTGLGLVISKKLVEAMKGTISASSVLGKGSSFRFSIPMPAVPSGPEKIDPDLSPLAGVRVLVIDPNAAVRAMLSHCARSWGMVAGEASDIDQGLAIIDGPECPGIVIAETSAPGVERMRQCNFPVRDGRPAPDVLLIGPHSERRTPESLGANALVKKPVRASKLREALLALLRPAGTATKSLTSLAGAVSAPDFAGANGKVLVAEDDAINQKLALKLLDRLGYQADLVEDGELAVQAAAKGGYSLVLMDCHMPVMDGFEAAETIRRLKGPAGLVPIVALTASALKTDRDRCLAAGMSDYLAKPINLAEMKAVLANWCGNSHLRSASGEKADWEAGAF